MEKNVQKPLLNKEPLAQVDPKPQTATSVLSKPSSYASLWSSRVSLRVSETEKWTGWVLCITPTWPLSSHIIPKRNTQVSQNCKRTGQSMLSWWETLKLIMFIFKHTTLLLQVSNYVQLHLFPIVLHPWQRTESFELPNDALFFSIAKFCFVLYKEVILLILSKIILSKSLFFSWLLLYRVTLAFFTVLTILSMDFHRYKTSFHNIPVKKGKKSQNRLNLYLF